MALNCKLSERIFTFEGKDYSYAQFQALLAEGLLARIPELTATAKETLATEEGRAEVEQGLSLDEARRRLMEMRDELEESDKSKSLRRALISVVGRMTEERAKKMARLLAPKLTIVRHSTSESLMAAHPQGSDVDGFYDYTKQVIHVGPRGNATHIIAHELLHPIFDNFIGVDEAKTARLYDELVKDERLVGFVEFGKNYLSKKDPSDITGIERSKVEALVDYLGAVADGKFDKELLGDSKFMQGVKEMLYRIMEFFGAKRPVVDITDVQTLKDLAKAIAIASKYGRAVKYVERDIDIDGVEGSMSEYPRSRAREIRFGNVANLYAGEDADLDGLERDRQIMAEDMEARGEDPEEIRATTGWFRGKYDNKWRKEIDDSEAVLLDDWKDIPIVNEYADSPDVKLSEVLDHKKLYEKYPEARDIKFSVRDMSSDGYFKLSNNEIAIKYNSKNSLSIILHEIQHWIQEKEGFAKGGTSKSALKNASKEILREGLNIAKESIKYKIENAKKIKPLIDELSNVMLSGLEPNDEMLDAISKHYFLEMFKRGTEERYNAALSEARANNIDPDNDPGVIEAKNKMDAASDNYNKYFVELFEAIGPQVAKKIGLPVDYRKVWDGSKFVTKQELGITSRWDLKEASKYGILAKKKLDKTIAELENNLERVEYDKEALLKELENSAFANNLYERIAGEIESRDVEARAKLTEEEKRQIAPYSSESIPKEKAIFVDEGISEMRADEGDYSDRFVTKEGRIKQLKAMGLDMVTVSSADADFVAQTRFEIVAGQHIHSGEVSYFVLPDGGIEVVDGSVIIGVDASFDKNLKHSWGPVEIYVGASAPSLESCYDYISFGKNSSAPSLKLVRGDAWFSYGSSANELSTITGNVSIRWKGDIDSEKVVRPSHGLSSLRVVGKDLYVGVSNVPDSLASGGVGKYTKAKSALEEFESKSKLQSPASGKEITPDALLPSLVSVGGNLEFSYSDGYAYKIGKISAPKLKVVFGNAKLARGSFVPSLARIEGNAVIGRGAFIPSLEYIGGALSFEGQAVLSDILGANLSKKYRMAGDSKRRISEMRADEGRAVPNEEYKKALDAAFKVIEETSERTWASLSRSEQATRMADAAVAAMKKSDWFKGLDIKQQRAAINELRNEIADRLGVKLAPKTEKQQQKAEEAAFKKGEKEGWKQAKEKAKEQAKRLKEKIAEALAAAKEGKETIKEKEKELTEAQKKEQKRIDKAYAVGLAEGKLGGEIFGKQKGREEGRKEMTKEQRLARKNFVAAVRAAMVDEDGKLIIRGKVGATQAMAIGSKAAKVDPMNSEQVAKFIDYVQKVIADAQYDQKVDRAKEAKRQLKKLAKSNKPSVIRSAAYDLSIVDIDMIDSLDEYIKMAEKVVAAGKSPSSDAYKMVNVEEVDELMTEIEEEIAENYKQLLIDEYGMEGISASDAKELYKFIEDEEGFNDLYNSLEEDKKQKLSNIFNVKAERAKNELEEWAKDNGILGLMVGRKFSESQVQVVKDLLGANVKNMTNAQKSLYIRAVDNLIVNDNFGGTTKVAAIAWASSKAKAAFDKFGSIFKKFNVGSKLEDARKGILSMPDLNTMFFGRSLKVGEVQVKMGLDMFRRGRQKAQEISDQIAKEQADFYTDLHRKYPQAAKADNLSAEGMVAYVIQKSPAFSLEESLEINKSIFQESIDVLKGSNKPKDNKQAEVLQGLFDAFVKNAKTREEILDNLKQFSPGNYESLMFLIGQHKKHKEAIKEANELNWDSPDASNDWSFEYYLPIRYDFTSAEPDFAEKNANAQLALSMRPGTMKKPVQSFGLRRRQRYTKLPKNSVVNLNIRRNSFNSLASNIWDASVTPALYRIQEFLKTPDAVNLFGGGSMGEQNAKFYVEVLDKWVNRYADAYKATEVEKGLNRAVNGVRRLTTAYALGGLVDPILKQGADPILATFMLTGGDKRILGNLFVQAGDGPQRLMSNYSIGSRGANAAYREWQGKVSSQIDKLERAISNSQWKRVENVYKWLLDNTMRTTGVTDAITARASWMTWYERAREQQGHEVKDWNAEADNINSDEDRQAAAMFAETMVGRSLAVSDPAEASSLAQKGKSFSINAVKAVFFLFSGFNIQKWSRKVQDYADLHRALSSGDPEAKKEAGPALRSLVTSFVQDVVFSAMTNFAIPKLRNVMGLLILQTLINAFVDEDDDEEKVNLLESYIRWVAVFRAFGIGYSDVDRWFKEARNILQEQITDKQVENIKNALFDEEDKEKITLAYEIGKQTEKEKKAAIAVKKSYTQWTTSLLMTDISPQLSDATIHAINSAYYSLLVSTKDPSVYNKDGEVKKFAQWAKDETNLALWKYGADKDIFSAGGLFDIVAKIPSTLSRQIEESEKNIEEAKWYYLYPKSGETKEQYNIRIKEETEKIKQNMLKDGVKPDVAQYTVDNALDLASEAWVNEGGSDELKEMKRKLISIMENDMKKKEQ